MINIRFRQSRLLFLPLLLALPGPGGGAGADEGSWKAGLAAADISPLEPVWLAGYAARNRPSEGVVHPIWVKALALQDARGRKLVVVTSDILGFTSAISEPLARRLETRYRLQRDQVLLTSSHTHTAPVVREYMVFAYGLSPEQEASVERYTKMLEEKVFEVVGAAIQKMESVRLSFGRGEAGFGVNRRVRKESGFTIAVNPEGPVDHEVPVLKIEAPDGRLRGVLFSYACHNTTLTGDFYQVSGDYSGFAQSELEKRYPGALALFASGCAGDINPNPRTKLEHARQHGEELASAVAAALSGKMNPVAGGLKTAFDHVSLPFAQPPSRAELEARLQETDRGRQRHARRMLDTLDKEGRLPDHYPYPVQVARFGQALTFVALGGEVVVDYSIRLKKELNRTPLFLVAYANDVMGYIPSLRVLKEGGYEGGGSMIFYGRPGPWAESVEELVVQKVHDLVRRTGQ